MKVTTDFPGGNAVFLDIGSDAAAADVHVAAAPTGQGNVFCPGRITAGPAPVLPIRYAGWLPAGPEHEDHDYVI